MCSEPECIRHGKEVKRKYLHVCAVCVCVNVRVCVCMCVCVLCVCVCVCVYVCMPGIQTNVLYTRSFVCLVRTITYDGCLITLYH